MDVVIVYESMFGNTHAVADAVAAGIAKRLRNGGYRLAAPPEGFIVTGTEGPLREGELARAREWGAGLVRQPAHV